ncbi:MAG: hypothetical protein OEZ01_02280 [Candidatus Heimdallarchaeota archaeon]|nr:hypothetical protein [Candidatus Heimdallarchaeota archaeon]MDH5644803.1 hypothetical protein [Candidatus Heimdallarchaeota archaeon]
MTLDQLETKFKSSIDDLKGMWDLISVEIDKLKGDSQSRVNQLEKENEDLSTKYNIAKEKLDKIEAQLANTVEQLESITKTKAKGIDAMQLLEVYLVLMEQVFQSQAHVRLLLMLHGARDQWTLNDLVKASGISAIEVRQAMFDLRNSGILEYDDETTNVTLLKRFLE